MLHIDDPKVKAFLLKGNFGLEKESLRITPNGRMSHTPDPFAGDPYIVRDFCENQTEINTPVFDSASKAVDSLESYTCKIQKKLASLEHPELLWPFSNPPVLENEDDIPVAVYTGVQASKTRYREYLSDRYGRYKMTLCGIHVNFSFSDELLKADFEAGGGCGVEEFKAYKDSLYVDLARAAARNSWILTALTAASPVLDASYFEKGRQNHDIFNGMASTRCSEIGYWNYFTPVLDYSDLAAYANSIQNYVDTGYLASPTELYYPVRLKPYGENTIQGLLNKGVSHIELRMFDLNPLTDCGIEVKDLEFTQLFLVWLACINNKEFTQSQQIQAAQDFKSAAHYDLKTVKTVSCDGQVSSMVDAAKCKILQIKDFYKNFDEHTKAVIDFEEAKLINPQLRYAWQIREKFEGTFLEKGLTRAIELQHSAIK